MDERILRIKKLKRNNKRIIVSGILVLLLVITIGFAFLNTNLNVTGTISAKSNSWDIYFDNIEMTEGPDDATQEIIDKTTITYNASLDYEDGYSFYVDIVNNGTMDAKISSIELPNITEKYIISYLSYEDFTPLSVGDLIKAKETLTIQYIIYYHGDITAEDLPSSDTPINGNIKIEFNQDDGTGISPNETDFARDSWGKIASKFHLSEHSYNVGDTKEIDLGELGKHTVRIANTTHCTGNESTTGCDLVIEFVDNITTHNMNSTNTNEGGWNKSELRNYLNTTIYNSFPEDLKPYIENTRVASAGKTSNTYYKSLDKIYLLSVKEIIGIEWSVSDKLTTILDYYKDTTSESLLTKKTNGVPDNWWLRDADVECDKGFIYIPADLQYFMETETLTDDSASNTYGVSPVFRIQNPFFRHQIEDELDKEINEDILYEYSET